MGSRTSRRFENSVSATGTTDTERTAAPSPYRSVSVRTSSAPSFTPGTTTIWVWKAIPCAANPRSCETISGASGLRSSQRRIVGSVACTETYSGDSRYSMIRSTSHGFRLVRVAKLP